METGQNLVQNDKDSLQKGRFDKVLFGSDQVCVDQEPGKGRCLRLLKDRVKPGRLFGEAPICAVVDVQHLSSICSFCFLPAGKRCVKCRKVHYCSRVRSWWMDEINCVN